MEWTPNARIASASNRCTDEGLGNRNQGSVGWQAGMRDRSIIVFADGGSTGNPGPGGWGAIVLTPHGEVAELGGGAPHTTNNRMELTAAIEALRYILDTEERVTLYSDSTYVVRGISQWIKAWKKRGWKTVEGSEVLNRDLWEMLDRLASERGLPGAVTWRHVPGHAGIGGNERADQIAHAYAAGQQPELYCGLLSAYPESLFPLPGETGAATAKSRGKGKRKSKPAHSYLSVVDGKPMRHAAWAECELRVQGKSRALFKKAASPDDEIEILRTWGFSLEDLL
jgi:ribonuclease HI